MIYKDLQRDLWRRLRDLQPVADPLLGNQLAVKQWH